MTEATPRDPLLLLVAYTDGELAAETSAAIEARLANSADLRNKLEDVRALQAGLRTHLPAAPKILDDAHRQAVLMVATPLRIHRWVNIRWVAAACLALGMLGLWMSSSVSVFKVKESDRESRIIETLGYSRFVPPAPAAAPDRIAPIRSLQANAEDASLVVEEPAMSSLEVEDNRSDVTQPKGREEALSDSVLGGDSDMVLIGAGNGAAGTFGERTSSGHERSITDPAKNGMTASDTMSVGGETAVAEKKNRMLPAELASKAGDGVVINELKANNAKETVSALVEASDRRDGKPDSGSADLKKIAQRLTAPARVTASGTSSDTVATTTNSKTAVFRTTDAPQAPPLSLPPMQVFAARQQEQVVGGVTVQIINRDLEQAATKRLNKDTLQAKPAIVAGSAGKRAATTEGRMNAGQLEPKQEAPQLSPKIAFQRIVLDDATVAGHDMLLQARRAGQQLRILPDCLEVTPGRRPLDPTATFGLAKADFQKAFHTVPMTATADTATLTFAFTADTASFDHAKSQLRAGQAMDPAAIHAEHFVNAVPTDYPPASGPEAFTLYAEAGASPLAAGSLASRTALVSVGAVSRPAGVGERRPLALTLAIDCSGSMAQPGGLDRVRAGLGELLRQLGDDDSVAVVAFDDRARVVLPATTGAERERIAAAVAGLQTSGSTNAGEGLSLAYQLAAESAKPGCESRVLLATDGATLAGDGAAPVLARIAADRARGITLIVVGCGGQQYQGNALDALAAQGDGQHVYLGSDDEARALFRDKLLPEKLGVLARDAKVQVTWNPQRVTHARLIGFETRRLSARDFRDDRVDAGELAQDSQATALFEVILADGGSGPLGTAAVRYLDTRLGTVRELACPLPGSLVRSHLSDRLRLMACSADLADLLGRTWWANQRCATYGNLLAELARCPQSAFRDVLRTMTQQAQGLTGEP